MKSVLQAAWLLTVAFGNLIVVIVAEARFIPNQVSHRLMFYVTKLQLSFINIYKWCCNERSFIHMSRKLYLHESNHFTDIFQAGEFFFFAGLSACIFIIFAIMSYFYKYVQDENVEKEMSDTVGLINGESNYVSDEENQNAAKNEL